MIEPADFSAFEARYRSGRAQLVWTTLVADLETPVSAMLKLSAGRTHCFLLESVEGGAVRGRFSFIGRDPDIVWRCRGDRAEINRRALDDPEELPAVRQGRARFAARADRGVPHRRPAGRPAADGGRAGRLYGLRHGAADGASARRAAGPHRHSRRPVLAPDRDGGVRPDRGPHHPGDAGLAGGGGLGRDRPAARQRAPGGGAGRPGGRRHRPPRERAGGAGASRAALQHDPRALLRGRRDRARLCPCRRRTSRSCRRSASPSTSPCRPLRSTGRSGG